MKARSWVSSIAICSMICFAGCARITVRRSRKIVPEHVAARTTVNSILMGTQPLSAPVDLSAICPKGWAQVSSETRPFQAFLHVITLNLYSPWTASVSCAPIEATKPDDSQD